MAPESDGRIVTFYSYKGGTGRTMALANAAWILASMGKRVLMIDWDLEAPGLHRYFHPFLTDKMLVSTKGVIDLVFEYQRTVLGHENATELRELPDAWYDEYATNVLRYITELEWDDGRQKGFGELHLLAAGQQTADYAPRVNTFNWRQLYENLGGYRFIEAVKRRLRREYDYVFVDSRTGVSDTSGLCTVQMPDALVVCFTLNSQSIEGASQVALDVREQREHDKSSSKLEPSVTGPLDTSERPFRIFPIPTRVEKAEKQKLDLARDVARTRFDTFLTWLPAPERERYWGGVEIFYEPFYAYEEVLATIADKAGAITSLLASVERLTGYVTEQPVRMPAIPESLRQEVLEMYERRSSEPDDPAQRATALFQRFTSDTAAVARAILLRVVTPGLGGSIMRRTVATADIANRETLERLVDERVLTRKLGEDEIEFVTIADERLLNWPMLRGWVREDADALAMRPLLEELTARWEGADRSSDLLLASSALLAAADAYRKPYLFNPRVAAYVKASEQRHKQRRKWTVIAIRAAVAAVALTVGLIFGFGEVRLWWQTSRILRRVQAKTNPVDGLVYVWIRPPDLRQFDMGCSWSESSDCKSIPVEMTRGYWLGQTEVTNAAYRKYLVSRSKATDLFPDNMLPASRVDWFDAVNYCNWAGGRLPDDAEWENAARGGERSLRYITGDTLDQKKISVGESPQRVARYPPNGFGLYDMTGNVAEWTGGSPGVFYSAISTSYYYGGGRDAKALKDPKLPPQESEQAVVRGGSFASVSKELQLHSATLSPLDNKDPTIGFRCAIDETNLEKVANSYRINPFLGQYELYSKYTYFGYSMPGFYEAWWYTVYLHFTEAERWRTPKQK